MIRISIGLSLLINAVLIGYVIGYTELLLFIAVLMIAGLVWYIRKVLNHHDEIDDDLSAMLENMSNFESHLHEIHEMEMFYGDSTLEGMIEHMNQMIDEISFYREKYFFLEEDEEQEKINDTEKETT
jgi:hypothetical protein